MVHSVTCASEYCHGLLRGRLRLRVFIFLASAMRLRSCMQHRLLYVLPKVQSFCTIHKHYWRHRVLNVINWPSVVAFRTHVQVVNHLILPSQITFRLQGHIGCIVFACITSASGVQIPERRVTLTIVCSGSTHSKDDSLQGHAQCNICTIQKALRPSIIGYITQQYMVFIFTRIFQALVQRPHEPLIDVNSSLQNLWTNLSFTENILGTSILISKSVC